MQNYIIITVTISPGHTSEGLWEPVSSVTVYECGATGSLTWGFLPNKKEAKNTHEPRQGCSSAQPVEKSSESSLLQDPKVVCVGLKR